MRAQQLCHPCVITWVKADNALLKDGQRKLPAHVERAPQA